MLAGPRRRISAANAVKIRNLSAAARALISSCLRAKRSKSPQNANAESVSPIDWKRLGGSAVLCDSRQIGIVGEHMHAARQFAGKKAAYWQA